MTEPRKSRSPQAFDPDDPAVTLEPVDPPPAAAERPLSRAAVAPDQPAASDAPTGPRRRGPGWMTVLIGALAGLVALAACVTFAQFVSITLARTDWVGMLAWSLLGVAALAGLVIALREMIGLMRLGRLARLRCDADAALRSRDMRAERSVVKRLRTALAGRPELAWGAARLQEHEGDVRDPGELLALADRELMRPLDAQARRLILGSAKRVSLVTAMSPIALVAVGYVLVENLRLLRALATLYGGRPGFLGGLRLARMVIVHMIATGGVALTDDLIGQFIGQDLARRLSRRLGEGLFNGALTARVGTAALDVCRPLPFVESQPVRVRDVIAELTRRAPAKTT